MTIPENAEIPEALEKRKFQGGLYAAYTIYAGEWNKWEQLIAWLESNTKYEWNGVENSSYMHGLIDEHINYIHHLNIPDEKVSDLQFDLLVPIKERELK